MRRVVTIVDRPGQRVRGAVVRVADGVADALPASEVGRARDRADTARLVALWAEAEALLPPVRHGHPIAVRDLRRLLELVGDPYVDAARAR